MRFCWARATCHGTFDYLFGALVVHLLLGRVGRQHSVEHVGFTLFRGSTRQCHTKTPQRLQSIIAPEPIQPVSPSPSETHPSALPDLPEPPTRGGENTDTHRMAVEGVSAARLTARGVQKDDATE